MKLKVMCPECGNEVPADFEATDWLDRTLDFRGEDDILVDHLVIRLKIECPKCGKTNIFEADSGPLIFIWVGP